VHASLIRLTFLSSRMQVYVFNPFSAQWYLHVPPVLISNSSFCIPGFLRYRSKEGLFPQPFKAEGGGGGGGGEVGG
jgi:hypothetical protein